MEIKQAAIVGTLESSDIQISLLPNPGKGLEIQLQSVVKVQYGDAIVATITEVLESFGITDAIVDAADRGALDWVIRARMQAACCRATGTKFNWKGEDQ
ncbi:MAG: citrate lyase acyl carrier protein [Oscillospiraceae bacterium]|nr:citrate lyase acyl carrier protein [Oscillospiraceae bacterium]